MEPAVKVMAPAATSVDWMLPLFQSMVLLLLAT
jgi:hypothetical protein